MNSNGTDTTPHTEISNIQLELLQQEFISFFPLRRVMSTLPKSDFERIFVLLIDARLSGNPDLTKYIHDLKKYCEEFNENRELSNETVRSMQEFWRNNVELALEVKNEIIRLLENLE